MGREKHEEEGYLETDATYEERKEEILGDNLVRVAMKQLESSVQHKQSRMEKIKEFEDSYDNVTTPVLRGRFNTPLPVMGGFVDTLMSKIDDPPKIIFEADDEADYKKAKKKNVFLEKVSSTASGKWAMKDRNSKKLAIMSGRGIMKYYADSMGGKYNSNLDVVDYYEFHCEPRGGGELESHLFCGQENIFKTKSSLEEGMQDGTYNKRQVMKLFSGVGESDLKENDVINQNKINRFESLNLNVSDNYVGESLYNLFEWFLNYKGDRYYLLFDYRSGVWIRAEKLKRVFGNNLYPYITWATHPNAFVFWTKGPADDVYPIAESMKRTINETMYNISKRNSGQRAYDINMFTDPSALEWRPDGLVPADVKGKKLEDGVWTFDTPDTTNISINLVDFFDNFIGKKTGITPDSQGLSEEKRVGIYYGNMQQVADRLGLLNKSYSEAWTDLGVRFNDGVNEHLKQDEAIKMAGMKTGIEWDKLTKDDLKTTRPLGVNVISASAEVNANEEKKKMRTEALAGLMGNPNTGARFSPDWVIGQVLKNAGYEDDEIKEATDTQEYIDKELMSEAVQAIEDICEGDKTPNLNRGATPAYMQKILDFAIDNDIEDDKFKALTEFAQAHMEIVMENTARKISKMQNSQGPAEIGAGPVNTPISNMNAGPASTANVPSAGGIEAPNMPNGVDGNVNQVN